MAEGLLRDLAAQKEIGLEIDSAGTGDWHQGEPPDERAVRQMEMRGHDISQLRARQIQTEDLDRFDVIFTMDASNYQNVLKLAQTEEQRQKVRMFLNEAWSGQNRQVPDPWFGGEEGFEQVYFLLERACEAFLQDLEP
jgi:protein-tyrosine phosphatase